MTPTYYSIYMAVEKQLEEARKWPLFSNLEPKIVYMLRQDRTLELEQAYIRAIKLSDEGISERSKARGRAFYNLYREAKVIASYWPFLRLDALVRDIETERLNHK